MKFYIATKFQNFDRVQEIRIYLESLGYSITYDWSRATVSDMAQAQLDVRGVREADFIVGIFEQDYKYKGAIAEVGMAIALGKPVFILGDWLDGMIFMKLPTVFKIDEISQIKSPEYFKNIWKEPRTAKGSLD